MSKYTIRNDSEKRDIRCPNILVRNRTSDVQIYHEKYNEKQDIGCPNLPREKQKYIITQNWLNFRQNHKFGPNYVNKGIGTSTVQNHSPWAAHIRL